ncbi:MAG: glycosyltransferase family 2 protein [Crocinitomicaceae bacterium]
MKNSVSVVIPNYNGENIIVQTINLAVEALKSSDLSSYEIIVSDDASTDQSISKIKKFFNDVIVLESKTNTGFSGNVNRGVKIATKELVLILNSDLHLEKGYFNSLIPLFENKNVFGVMGSIKDPITLDFQDGAKIPILKFNLFISSNKNKFSKSAIIPTFFLSGANALVRKDYFLQLGGFCEIFNPYYSEDVDLGIRAWKMGWELYFQPNAICYHEISTTIKKISKEKVAITAKRNKYILHALHLPKHWLIVYELNLIFISLFRVISGDKLYFKALFSYFGLKKEIRKERIKFFNLNEKQKKLDLNQIINKIKSIDSH